MQSGNKFIYFICITIILTGVSFIIKYLNDTLFKEGKINIVEMVQIVYYFIIFCSSVGIIIFFALDITLKFKDLNKWYLCYYISILLLLFCVMIISKIFFISKCVMNSEEIDFNNITNSIESLGKKLQNKLGEPLIFGFSTLISINILVTIFIVIGILIIFINFGVGIIMISIIITIIIIIFIIIYFILKYVNIYNYSGLLLGPFYYTITVIISLKIYFENFWNNNDDDENKVKIIIKGIIASLFYYIPYLYIKEHIKSFIYSCHSTSKYKFIYNFTPFINHK